MGLPTQDRSIVVGYLRAPEGNGLGGDRGRWVGQAWGRYPSAPNFPLVHFDAAGNLIGGCGHFTLDPRRAGEGNRVSPLYPGFPPPAIFPCLEPVIRLTPKNESPGDPLGTSRTLDK